MVLALSLPDQVQEVGVIVGIASFFGLAALAVLYFAQAREVKRLREWALAALQREQELEKRVVARADALARSHAQRVGGAAPAPPPPAPVAVELPPLEVPDGVPAVAVVAARARRGAISVATLSALPAVARAAAAVAAGRAQPEPVAAPAELEPVAAAPAELEPVAAAPAELDERTEVVPAATAAAVAAALPAQQAQRAAGGNGGPVERPRPIGLPVHPDDVPPRSQPAAMPARSRAASAPRPAPALPRAARRRSRALVPVLVFVLILGAGIFVGSLVFGGDEEPLEPNVPGTVVEEGSGAAQPRARATATPSVSRAETTVAVLNGTTQNGLAKDTLTRVEATGYAPGLADTHADQQQQRSVVLYADGFAGHARQVAQTLGIATRRALDADTAALATADGQSAPDVVVVVGADKASE